MSGQTPGQAAYEAHYQNPAMDFREDVGAPEREHWEAAAQAAIDVFLAGDSVSAESIREALAAQEQPAPELAAERWDAGTIENTETGTTWVTWDSRLPPPWPKVAEAVSRLSGGKVLVRQYNGGDEDPDGRSCVVIERGAQEQPAPELATGPCPFDGHDGEHLRLNTHGHWLCAINLTDMLVAADVITDLQPADSRRYREALEHVRAIILEGDNSTEGSRLRRLRAFIRAALEGK